MIITDDCSELIIALINLIKIKQHLVFTKRERGNKEKRGVKERAETILHKEC